MNDREMWRRTMAYMNSLPTRNLFSVFRWTGGKRVEIPNPFEDNREEMLRWAGYDPTNLFGLNQNVRTHRPRGG